MPSDSPTNKAPAPDRRVFLAGTTIYKEGDLADAVYILESGSVQIFKMINGRRIPLATIPPWGLFGELGLLDEAPRIAAAYVTEDATCIALSKDVILRMFDGVPDSVLALIRSLVQTIKSTSENLADARYQLQDQDR